MPRPTIPLPPPVILLAGNQKKPMPPIPHDMKTMGEFGEFIRWSKQPPSDLPMPQRRAWGQNHNQQVLAEYQSNPREIQKLWDRGVTPEMLLKWKGFYDSQSAASAHQSQKNNPTAPVRAEFVSALHNLMLRDDGSVSSN